MIFYKKYLKRSIINENSDMDITLKGIGVSRQDILDIVIRQFNVNSTELWEAFIKKYPNKNTSNI
jgi:hypothetical protein